MAKAPEQLINRGAVFNRRLVLLGGAQLAAFGAIGARLYGLQVREAETLGQQGLDVITKREFSLPERGSISDREGRILATNRKTTQVQLRLRDYPGAPREAEAARAGEQPKASLRAYIEAFGLDPQTELRVHLDLDLALGVIPSTFYLDQLSRLPQKLQNQADFADVAEAAIQEGEEALKPLKRETLVTVVEDISRSRSQLIASRQADMPLIEVSMGFRRRYEFIEVERFVEAEETGEAQVRTEELAAVSHIVGYTKRVFKEDLLDDTDPLLRLPSARIGATGIEASYDRTLRGKAGYATWQITGGGRKLRQLDEKSPEPGEDLTLTIDLPLQRTALNMLAQYEEAAAVVMDVETGEILVMASQPFFNVNDFVPRISQQVWNQYIRNERKPLFARASQGSYPPGSTFKMIITLAALEHGFTPSTTWTCSGSLEVSGQRFRCWKRRGHGDMDMYGALRESCDVWFYHAAHAIGIEKMREVAARFGFGEEVIANFYEQAEALLPSRQWKEARGERWVIGDSVQFSIGQGFMLATPVQLATMTAIIANGGYRIRPHLVSVNGFYNKQDLQLDPAHLRVLQEGMRQVVNDDRGTAKKSKLELPWGPNGEVWRMAGKTGTAQVTSLPPDESDTINEDIPYDKRDHALFVAYAPLDKPRYACAVVVEHGGSGSATAAPLASNLLTATLARDIGT